MGRLIDGEWTTHDMGPDERGRYVRRAAKYRGVVTADGSSGFLAEAGRYHLYASHACGWCHRVLMMRALKGLGDVISVSYVEPFMGDRGWTIGEGQDPIHGARYLYEVYLRDRTDYTGRVSVPVFWDRKTARIVTNESLDLIRMFDREFDALTDNRRRLFPDSQRVAVDEMITANYGPVNNGVYRAGFAGNQESYAEAVRALFRRLDELEALLAERRFLLGDELTAADLCLFPTLFRFDAIYYIHFKCSVRRLQDYPNLWGYARDVYQQPGISETCEIEVAREHYFTSHESVNPRRFVPLGPVPDFDAPHDRHRLARAGAE